MESFFERRKVEFSTLTNLSHLTKGTKNHLRNVYACLSIALVFAAGGAYLNLRNAFFAGNNFISTIILFGCVIWLSSTPHTKENLNKRLGILCGLAFFIGANTSPLLQLAISINPALIVTAFLTTSSIFVCFTLSALVARRRTYLFLGGILSSMCIAMLVGLLFASHSNGMIKMYLYAGVAMSLGFILYDTQVIIEKHMSGDDDFIMHSVDLFIDFVNLFRMLLALLASKEEEKKRRRR